MQDDPDLARQEPSPGAAPVQRRDLQAVILVGGTGSRLGSVSRQTPKPLLAVGGRPFLDWLLDWLGDQGVRRVLLLAGFMADQVEAFAKSRPGVTVSIESSPLGTAGALRNALDHLDERFLLMNGDSVFAIPLDRLLEADAPNGAATLALRIAPDAGRYGVVSTNGDRVTDFNARPSTPGAALINAGVAVLSRAALASAVPAGQFVSLEDRLYPAWAAEGRLRGRAFEAPFIDIGVPEDFARAQAYVPDMLRT